MVLPKRLARVNRVATNKVSGAVAGWLPGFAIVQHVGRRSGRVYRTPVNVVRVASGYVVALTYGPDADWVRNVQAAGACRLELRGSTHEVAYEGTVRDESRSAFPRWVRPVLRLFGVTEFLRLRPHDRRVSRTQESR